MLEQRGTHYGPPALGRAYFSRKTVTGGLLRIRRHRQLEFGTKPHVLEHGILVSPPQFVTFRARHLDRSGFILSTGYPECRTFSRWTFGHVQFFSIL